MKLQKITRWYDDACGSAHALELIGERWALLIMRELMFGPRRFGEVRAALPGLSANILTQRLAGLEVAGIVVRHKLPSPASVQVYALTAWGYEAEPILQVTGRWAARSPAHDPTLPLSAASLMLSLRTMHAPDRVGDLDARIGFVLGEETFVAALTRAAIAIARGDPSGADVVLSGTPEALAGVFYGGAPLATITVSGDLALARRITTMFVLPSKAST